MKFDFNATKQVVEKQYNLGKGEYFKVKEGMNKIRLVSACLPHESEYKGQKTFKWLCQIIDMRDGKVKPYFMPHSVYQMIADLQLSDDYKFDEVPMPYLISVNAAGAGTKEVKYSVTPARLNTPLTAAELQAISEAPTVEELQKKIRDSEKTPADVVTKEQAAVQINGEVNVDEIPF